MHLNQVATSGTEVNLGSTSYTQVRPNGTCVTDVNEVGTCGIHVKQGLVSALLKGLVLGRSNTNNLLMPGLSYGGERAY